jgi:hypothetical protein
MVRIFKALGWMSVDLDVDESLVELETEKERKGKTDNEYKVACALIEGWFPKVAWGELNQTWAGLGQLLAEQERCQKNSGVGRFRVKVVDQQLESSRL